MFGFRMSHMLYNFFSYRRLYNFLSYAVLKTLGKTSREKMAKTEFLMKWDPRPSASAAHRQTGWDLHQRGGSNDACATPQRRPRHELAWIWTDFLSEQRRATGSVEPAGRAVGKWQPAWCLCKTQDKFAIAFMAKKLLHRCICAHARVISTGVVSTMHVQVCR